LSTASAFDYSTEPDLGWLNADPACRMENAMMGASLRIVTAVSVAGGLSLAAAVDAKELGMVHFETSCKPVAQKQFDLAMTYQHSFWYRSSRKTFEDALKADPECGIAYWGIAMSLLNNPFNPPPAQNLPDGLTAVTKGKEVGAKTQREKDFIDAIAAFYTDYDKIDHRTRVQAYLKAMEAMAARYPKDDETQIYYALALNVAASPNDKTYANQLKAAAILEPIFKRQPQHPGVAHYLIHTYDYPPIAEKGLVAAKRYSKIAPAAPHAQHMPSHIFTRVGAWRESIASNIASVRAAKADNEPNDQLHGMDYMVYAYLQLAEDKKAKGVIDEMGAASVPPTATLGFVFARAASPARYALERGDWKAAAELVVVPTKFAQADAITHFARALGAARSGNPDAAKADIAKLAELRDRLKQEKNAYWAEQVDIQSQIAIAWTLHAQGKYDEALSAMKAAADVEDATEKSPVTPGPLVPARELYGAMLLDRGNAKEALTAFETTLKKEPHRLRATLGAAKAAEAAADANAARSYYGKAVQLAAGADTDRPDVLDARAVVAKKRPLGGTHASGPAPK
jgi:tetratricopeptide (TPR) repeat protein